MRKRIPKAIALAPVVALLAAALVLGGNTAAFATSINIANTATASASSLDTVDGSTPNQAIDGAVTGYPTTGGTGEWSMNAAKTGWIRLTFPAPVTIDHVVLHDRINSQDQVIGSNLTFSAGASVTTGTLANDGTGKTVSFTSRSVAWVQFNITSGSSGSYANGLAEFEVWGSPTARPTNTTTPQPPTTQQGGPDSRCVTSGATGATSSAAFTSTATPDDGTDDTTAIQNAINAAGSAGGGVVKLALGTFTINGKLKMKTGVTLAGSGSGTILKAGSSFLNNTGPAGGYPIVTTAGASNITLRNFTADQSGDTLAAAGKSGRLNEYLIDIRNSTNSYINQIHTINPFTYSIVPVGSDHFCITDSSTISATVGKYDQLDGIHVMNSSFGDVVNNTVDQGAGGASGDGDDGLVAHTYGGSVHDIQYLNNKVRPGRNGDGFDFALTNSGDRIYNIKVAGNEFWGAAGLGGVVVNYFGSGGSVDHTTVDSNYIHDNLGGYAVKMLGGVTYMTVTNNHACNSGGFTLTSGTGNSTSGNTSSCP